MTLTDAMTQSRQWPVLPAPSAGKLDEPEINSVSCHISIWKRISFHSVMVIRHIKYENGNPIWKDTFSLFRSQ